jgi:hypothetical protein
MRICCKSMNMYKNLFHPDEGGVVVPYLEIVKGKQDKFFGKVTDIQTEDVMIFFCPWCGARLGPGDKEINREEGFMTP